MNAVQMSLDEIRQHGIDALARELGPVGMIRFLQQFETGKGDYTLERHQWLPDDVADIERTMQGKTPTPAKSDDAAGAA